MSLLNIGLMVMPLVSITGAFYQNFFGGLWGMTFSAGVLIRWILAPLIAGTRIFIKKDS